jgi:hypothetical protein
MAANLFKHSLMAVFAVTLSGCGGVTDANFQSDADVYRLKDLQYYGVLIEAYHDRTGSYPFLDEAGAKPVYAIIASPEQVDDVQDLPFAHTLKSAGNFFAELESGLGEPVQEYYDPQFEPDTKPNFYIYMAREDRYFFAVHISQPHDFAQPVGPGYTKVEISNISTPDSYVVLPEVLFSSPSFLNALQVSITKPGFFEGRREQFISASKQSG